MSELVSERSSVEPLSAIRRRFAASLESFNSEQRRIYDDVVSNTVNQTPRLIYINGPGGTGKTFLLNTIIDFAFVNNIEHEVVVALLLKGGRTAHSTFGISIEIEKNSECSFDADSTLGRRLAQTKLIIWDEAVAMHRFAIEAVDRSLRMTHGRDEPFGGKVVIFSGDFRQILPVVKYNEYPWSYDATLESSPLWSKITQLKLINNMRLLSGNDDSSREQNKAFAKYLLKLGEGKLQSDDYAEVELEDVNVVMEDIIETAITKVIDFVYGDLSGFGETDDVEKTDCLNSRCILAPLNRDVRGLNYQILKNCRGEKICSRSIDRPDPDSWDLLPEEVLNKLSISNFPEHEIFMKVGMPIVILRNLYVNRGVCNGSRIIITHVGDGFVMAKLMEGSFKGDIISIPKFKLLNKGSPRSGLLFYRYQFPLAPCFAMSVNKAQGQTLGRVGVMLKADLFSHGQLYVALSRVSLVENLMVVANKSEEGVINVVHKSMFTREGNV